MNQQNQNGGRVVSDTIRHTPPVEAAPRVEWCLTPFDASDVGGGYADAVVGGLDQAGGAGVAGQAEGHAVHDLAEADAVLGVGDAPLTAGPELAEGGRPAVPGDLRSLDTARPPGGL